MAANNEFGISLNTTLNTKNVPNAINRLQAELNKSTTTKIELPVKVTINGKEKEKLKTFFKEISTYKDKLGNTFKSKKIIDLQGNVVSNEITQVTSALKTLTTETHKWTNTQGEINTWTTSVNNAGETVQTRSKQYVTDMGEMITETSNWGRNSKGQWTQVGETVKKTTDLVKDTTTST